MGFGQKRNTQESLDSQVFSWWSVLDSNQALAHPAKLKTRELRQKAHRIHSYSGALFQCLVSKRVLERVIPLHLFSDTFRN